MRADVVDGFIAAVKRVNSFSGVRVPDKLLHESWGSVEVPTYVKSSVIVGRTPIGLCTLQDVALSLEQQRGPSRIRATLERENEVKGTSLPTGNTLCYVLIQQAPHAEPSTEEDIVQLTEKLEELVAALEAATDASTDASLDLGDRVKRLYDLRQKNLITRAEFDARLLQIHKELGV